MKTVNFSIAALLLSLLLATWTKTANGAASGKGGTNQRGGKAAAHMSDKGTFNSNGQWSADPDRGWVRAEKRHQIRDQREVGPDRVKKNNGKAKGKGRSNNS